MLVDPKNINSAYPDDSDYFELKEIQGRSLQFFYGNDIDSIDFNEFCTNKVFTFGGFALYEEVIDSTLNKPSDDTDDGTEECEDDVDRCRKIKQQCIEGCSSET